MVDKAADGAIGEAFPMEIERGKIREFGQAIFSEHPDYLAAERPVIPPTFLTTTFFWERYVKDSNPLDRVKLDPSRSLHAEQEYIFHGPPPRAGDSLRCQSRIERIYEKESERRGTLAFVVMVTEFRNQMDELVAEARMTAVELPGAEP